MKKFMKFLFVLTLIGGTIAGVLYFAKTIFMKDYLDDYDDDFDNDLYDEDEDEDDREYVTIPVPNDDDENNEDNTSN